ncbi:hypothetical protein ACFSUF_15460 [Paenibacillus gansuensis]|uniref:Uncharacterized protein n=1 Tax=Paenibacillus gansuensis TaxID=306542 RepID=A0ABW5PGV3_9BACL
MQMEMLEELQMNQDIILQQLSKKNYEQIFKSAGIKTENAWLEIYQLELTGNGYVDLGKLRKLQSTKLK